MSASDDETILNSGIPLSSALPSGTRLGDYELEKLLGAGAMGENPGMRLTLEEIARYGGCTRERVQQIESRALRKLRNRPQILRRMGEAGTERN